MHALNGAFHYLTTSNLPERNSPPHLHSSQSASSINDFKVEPNIDVDDMPTDLSTGGDRKYQNSSNSDCYP